MTVRELAAAISLPIRLLRYVLEQKVVPGVVIELSGLMAGRPRTLSAVACKAGVRQRLGIGMRIGEVEHLTWEDLGFDNGVIHIRAKPGWRVKTGDVRSVPMSSGVRALLLRQPRVATWVFTFSEDYAPARQISPRRPLDYLKRQLTKLGAPLHVPAFVHFDLADKQHSRGHGRRPIS